MKKSLLILFLFSAFCFTNANIASAEISIRDYMSYEFLDTQGYSGEMLRLVEINKAKTFAEEIPDQWPRNPIARAYKKIMAYIDPATDYGDFGMHEIKIENSWRDY